MCPDIAERPRRECPGARQQSRGEEEAANGLQFWGDVTVRLLSLGEATVSDLYLPAVIFGKRDIYKFTRMAQTGHLFVNWASVSVAHRAVG